MPTSFKESAEAVLAWGIPRLRNLPWRHTRDPWAILVSEVMLQQTQVARVVPRWEEFLADYPTPGACAAVPLGDVLRGWQGLGYPRRARNLHATATIVEHEHGGLLPADLGDLLALPGIGPYTARAVLAFAYERDVGVVDTNIARVLARVTGERLTGRGVQALADDLVPHGEGWAWNQVVMDLGATICRPAPRCGECPLRRVCTWAAAGRPDPDPAIGSAGVSGRQAPYVGSMRERRGRVMRSLGQAALRADDADVDAEAVASLAVDGLVVEHADGTITLP